MFVFGALSHVYHGGRMPNTTSFPDGMIAGKRDPSVQEPMNDVSNAKTELVLTTVRAT